MFLNLLAAFRATLSKFRRSQSGNVAIIFGIAVVPVVLSVGGFIDYQRASVARSQMQDALDATALALHTDAATMTQAQMNDFALKYFTANYTNGDATSIVVTPAYDSSGPTVTVGGAATVKMSFLPLIGIPTIPISAQSVTTWGQARLRVALVLDNTGSMSSSGKMTALKTATHNLLTQLKNAATKDGDVYVSIIPFSRDVNVDPASYNKAWVRWDNASADPTDSANDAWWDGANGSCSISGNAPRSVCLASATCSITSKTSQSTCTAAGTCSITSKTTQSTCTAAGTCSVSSRTTQASCIVGTCSISGRTTQASCIAGSCSISGNTTQSTCQAAGTCSRSQYTTKTTCQNNHWTWTAGVWTAGGTWTGPGTWTAGVWTAGVWTAGVWTPAAHTTWNGCIMDRDQDYDTKNTEPVADATLFPADQYSNCPGAMMGLSYDWTALGAEVDAMFPNGSTNQTIGLAWGWQSLTAAPFTIPAFDSAYQYKTIIILLTDGLNTQERWYGDGSHTSTQVNDREEILCQNVRDASVILYTIQVNTGGDATSTLLSDCATTSDKFFLLTTADQILTTFDEIGKALSDLRLAS